MFELVGEFLLEVSLRHDDFTQAQTPTTDGHDTSVKSFGNVIAHKPIAPRGEDGAVVMTCGAIKLWRDPNGRRR